MKAWWRDMGFCSPNHLRMSPDDYWRAEHRPGETGCLAYLSAWESIALYERQFGPLEIKTKEV
jgi:hypothetical protein